VLDLEELRDLANSMGLSDVGGREELINRIPDELDEGEAGFED